ncbi:uncharacterized protein LTR77_002460 [Saxophila tyrrhenica]|uniref:ZZ-type domain-containing protein n=1 Tax=Saxophila tyrrhenica TaxID=1690608 RepID=A0AAV9PJA0_9PEZI|nr:hypothetical protein LTR77_002460 [Saxophila tyrrhenica]
MADEEPTFQCSVCLGDERPPPRHIKGDLLCQDCYTESITREFNRAFESVAGFPPKWGNIDTTILQANDFVDVLGADFVTRFNRIAEDYRNENMVKVYCTHVMQKAHEPLKGGSPPDGVVLALSPEALASLDEDTPTIECRGMVGERTEQLGNVQECYHGKVSPAKWLCTQTSTNVSLPHPPPLDKSGGQGALELTGK